jgi:hypothetical protein
MYTRAMHAYPSLKIIKMVKLGLLNMIFLGHYAFYLTDIVRLVLSVLYITVE